MAKIVAALAMVHNPFITGFPDAADPDQAHAVHAAYAAQRRELEAASPDWALVITNEHLRNAFYPYLPPLTLGVAPRFHSAKEPGAGLEEQVVPSDESVSSQMLEAIWDGGADVAYSHDLVLDHGTMVPLHFLTPNLDLPIVHIHQTTSRGPRAPLKRCYELGRILRQVVEARPSSERVAVIGTGGLSHWVGGPRMGQVNAAWDVHVLDLFKRRDDASLLAITNADIESAGNGAHEIRNWITVAGIVPEAPAEVVGYVEHIPPWIMGSAHVRFNLAKDG
jgi:hypothetical protein